MPIYNLTSLVGNSRRREDLLKEFSLPGLSIDNLTSTPRTGSMETDTVAASIGKQVAQVNALLGDMLASQNRQISQLLAGSTTLQSSASRSTGAPTGSKGGMLSDLFGGLFSLSPVLDGLFSMFGNSSGEPIQPLVPFELPSAINYEGALSQTQSGVVPLDYGQDGRARPLTSTHNTASSQTVQIQVNAMDSQSFLDHSEDIARAVRLALLNSNTLNDVITDL